MTQEIIFCAPDEDSVLSEAARLGFVDSNGVILTHGKLDSGGWFLNIVGIIYEPPMYPTDSSHEEPEFIARAGYWGRLRINGNVQDMPVFSSNITQYIWNGHINGWTSDGVTLAPDWISTVATIA